MHRWDDTELEELPTYMRTCIHALQDVTNEIAYEIGGENNFHLVLSYLKKAVTLHIAHYTITTSFKHRLL